MAESDNRPSAYDEDGTSIYRASSIGKCTTALVAAKLGFKPARGEYQQGILDNAAYEGSSQESVIIDTLKEREGWRVWGGQEVMEHKVIPKVIVRGHIDGFCIPKGARNDRLLEIKTMSESRFKSWKGAGPNVRARLMSEGFITYGWQISMYMHAYGLPAMYVVKNRNTGELMIEELKLPTVDMKAIRKKVIEVEMWSKRDELPPCAASNADRFFCEYPYLHDDGKVFDDEPEIELPVVGSATAALIAGIAEHYADLAKQVSLLKPLDDERKNVGKKLIDAMGGSVEVQAEGWLVKKITSNRKSYDIEAAAVKLGIDPDELEKALNETKQDNHFSYPQVKRMGDR